MGVVGMALLKRKQVMITCGEVSGVLSPNAARGWTKLPPKDFESCADLVWIPFVLLPLVLI